MRHTSDAMMHVNFAAKIFGGSDPAVTLSLQRGRSEHYRRQDGTQGIGLSFLPQLQSQEGEV